MTPLHADRRRADSFGLQAERYDRARPRYPAAMYDAILGGNGVRDARGGALPVDYTTWLVTARLCEDRAA